LGKKHYIIILPFQFVNCIVIDRIQSDEILGKKHYIMIQPFEFVNCIVIDRIQSDELLVFYMNYDLECK